VAAGRTTFLTALAKPLEALLPTSLARSVGLPSREGVAGGRGAARVRGRDFERELRLLEAGLPPEPVVRREA
jgi:hypothetical protein